ncbi:glutaredoxin domain-containing protein [Streptomyces sp. NPDC020807]|uniref:glutaredoxin domain-containing protein n=1 Tax=Streptomyces sp. NPDC020807 TaxID=3155119 RepID=UPI0033E73E8A
MVSVRVWGVPGLFLLCAVLAAAGRGSVGAAVLGALPLLALAVLTSPLVFPRASADDGRPVVYWRPGCVYCLRLRLRLGVRARRARWVNIWRDPEGAAAVRAATGGDETVPTVVAAGRARVNPDPALVRELLASS